MMFGLEASLTTPAGHFARDQAVLAFLKCHITSVPRWQVVWYMAQRPGWHSIRDVAGACKQPELLMAQALEALREEGILSRRPHAIGGWTYTFRDEATRVVAERLVHQAVQSASLRQAIVACLASHRSEETDRVAAATAGPSRLPDASFPSASRRWCDSLGGSEAPSPVKAS